MFYRRGKEPDQQFLHLWAHDVVTGEERLVSKLDNAVRSFLRVVGDRLAVSPDRRWIAFASHFRPSPEDAFHKARTAMIWRVSVDGAQFVRVSAPLTDTRKPCSNGCPENQFCEPPADRCTFGGWNWGFEHPSWSPDGQRIVAHLAQTACSNVACAPNVVTPLVPAVAVISDAVSFSDKPLSPFVAVPRPTETGCNTNRPRVSPDGKRLAVQYGGCFGLDTWGVLFSNLDGSDYQRSAIRICTHIEWRHDSAGVYCTHSNQLSFLAPGKAEVPIFSAPDDLRLDIFSLSSDGRWLAVSGARGGRADIFVADLTLTPLESGQGVDFRPVTTDGASGWPAF